MQGFLEEASYRHGHAVATDVDLRAPPPRLKETTAAALCCVPVHGSHLFAAIYFRLVEDSRPLVVFSARQSAQNLTFTLLGFLALTLVVGIPSALLEGTSARAPLLVAFLVASGVLFAGYLGSSAVAVVQAKRGVAWRVPWLKPFQKRW